MKQLIVFLFFFMLFVSIPVSAQVTAPGAINPVYDGDDGILANIIRPKCLVCHLSTLPAGQRNGAPVGVNFDTFASARPFGDEMIEHAVVLMDMPPGSPLSDAEKQALQNWQTLGFPESALPAHYFPATQTLELPEVFIIGADGSISSKVKASMLLIPPFEAPFRFEIQQLEVSGVGSGATP